MSERMTRRDKLQEPPSRRAGNEAAAPSSGERPDHDEIARHRDLLQQIFDHVPVLLVVWDPRLWSFTLNRHAETVLGWSTEEANACDFLAEVYPDPDYRAEVAEFMLSLAQGFHEWTVTTRSGHPVPIQWANVHLADDAMLGIGIDVRRRKQAQEALRRSAAEAEAGARMLTALMDHVPDGITVADADLNLIRVSRHGQELLGAHEGRPLEALVSQGMVCQADGTTPMAHEDIPLVRAVRGGETVQDVEIVQVDTHGRKLPLLCNAVPIRDAEGTITGGIVAWRDISERKRSEAALRESEAKYRSLFESMDEGFCIVEVIFDGAQRATDFRFLETNPAFELHTGIQNPRGRTVRELVPNVEEGWFGTLGRIALGGDPFRFVGHAVGLDRWLDVYAWGHGPAELRQVAGVFTNITERRQAERALRKANEDLERKVEERTSELARRAEQLRWLASELTLAEQRERRRLAEVLHDDLQQLMVAAKLQLTPLRRTSDEKVKEAALQAEELIDDSIQRSRSLSGELSPPILYRGGLLPALEWLAVWMKDKHALAVNLQTTDDAAPESEDVTVLLFQSVRELLFNVVKHAGVGSARVVLARDGDLVQLTVADDGVGFDPETLELDGARPAGFGLFSIRERLDLMGGSLDIDASPGRGARFTVTAPIAAPARDGDQPPDVLTAVKVSRVGAPSNEAAAPACGVGRRIRLVLVDDHVVMRQGLASMLRAEPDLEIVGEASDGETAVEMVRLLRPDVVTMDVSMPGMDGIEATRIIHSDLPGVRVIGLSMFEEAERSRAMREAGAVAYLTKSGPGQALVAAIRASMGTGSVAP